MMSNTRTIINNGKLLKSVSSVENIIAGIISILLAVIQGFASPLHPWIRGDVDIDSGVFQTVALMMQNGYMPYRDSFDHKGPVLYILNLIGRIFGGYCGVWYVEIIAIAITIFFMYKVSRLVSCQFYSTISTLVGLALLNNYFEGGNFSEEFAIPFIAISTYIFADYCIRGVISKIRLMVCGACMGAVLMIRPNMIALWVAFCFAIAIHTLAIKKFRNLGMFILYFFIGMVTTVVPILIWLGINSDIKEFIYAYFLFNMNYSASTLNDKFLSFSFFFTFPCIIAIECIVIKCFRKKNRFFNITYLIYTVLAFLFISMSGRCYGHYGIVLTPVINYPIASILGEFESLRNKFASKLIGSFLCVCMIVLIFVPSWKNLVMNIPDVYSDRNNNHVSYDANAICEIINSSSNESAKISVYGSWDTIYVLTNKVHATDYSFQFPISDTDPQILNNYFTQLQEELPEMIVVCGGCQHKSMTKFLQDNNYELVYASNPDDLNDGPTLYQRIQETT